VAGACGFSDARNIDIVNELGLVPTAIDAKNHASPSPLEAAAKRIT